jgi:2-oxoisovalerate dehydrogenase E2 component (dihydrolipoyl transacylase)
MPTTITMPQLGETVTEGTVAQWLKKPGDAVEKYEAFVEVSTDKVNAEVPSPVAGIIRELIVNEGETVPTGAPIAVIDEATVGPAAPPERLPAGPPPPAAPVTPATAVTLPTNGTHNGSTANGTRVSPAVRRLAREHTVDLAHVAGTGSNGRITADDILAAARRSTPTLPPGPLFVEGAGPAVPAAPAAAPEPARAGPVALGDLIPLTPARRLIAQRMVESKRTAPHAWTMVEVDVTNVWKWRTAARDGFERETGTKLTLLPFFMHAVAQALRAFPLMNATFRDDGILVHKHVHLGVATAIDGNLLVPVVRDADRLSIRGLAIATGSLVDRARRGKLGADDLAGGTFTVNNNGANGSVLSAPILVGGQAGIVTMEAVVKRPVVRDDDAIAIRSMMNVCLSLDHRVIDGAVANGFLADLKGRLTAMGPSGTL